MSETRPFRTSFAFPVLGLLFLVVLWIFDYNHAAFQGINQLSLYTGEHIWAAMTLLGDPVVILCLALGLLRIQPRVTLAILPTLLIGLASVTTLKHVFAIDRPGLVMDQFILIGSQLYSPAFPSGHTAGAIAFATLLLINTKNKSLAFIIATLAVLVGISRIAIGVHWPMDVAAGMVIGWICAICGHLIAKKWQISRTGEKFLGLLLLIAAVFLLFKNTGQSELYPLQWLIAAMTCIVSATVILKKPAIAKS